VMALQSAEKLNNFTPQSLQACFFVFSSTPTRCRSWRFLLS